MSQPLEERLNYHPDPRGAQLSDRKVDARLRLIESRIDFQDKVVADFGCSGGMFSFSLAKRAKYIFAIDGDAEVIRRNREIQADLKIQNIEFIHANLTAAQCKAVGKVDVTLFLAVYHHMLATSEAYSWNTAQTRDDSDEFIDEMNANTSVLAFEIGYPNEGYEWCSRLPKYGNSWDDFVFRNVFRSAYSETEAALPDIPVGWWNKYLVSRLSRPYQEDSILTQRAKSLFGYDPRDRRKMYFGKK